MQAESAEVLYSLDGILYKVIETSETHKLIAEDAAFAVKYFNQNKACLEIVGVDEEGEVVEDNNNTEAVSNFMWDVKATKLLISHYYEPKDAFRGSKVKKRPLWCQIEKEFANKGYRRVSIDILDTKFRNMKKTFKTILDNNKKKEIGRGRLSWPYYDEFLIIFQDDRTINFGHTITSSCKSNEASALNSMSTCISAVPNPHLKPLSLLNPNLSTPLAVSTITNVSKDVNNSSPVPSNEFLATTPTRNLVNSQRGKKLYQFRKQQIDIEERGVQKLKELKEAVERSNQIQERRN